MSSSHSAPNAAIFAATSDVSVSSPICRVSSAIFASFCADTDRRVFFSASAFCAAWSRLFWSFCLSRFRSLISFRSALPSSDFPESLDSASASRALSSSISAKRPSASLRRCVSWSSELCFLMCSAARADFASVTAWRAACFHRR